MARHNGFGDDLERGSAGTRQHLARGETELRQRDRHRIVIDVESDDEGVVADA